MQHIVSSKSHIPVEVVRSKIDMLSSISSEIARDFDDQLNAILELYVQSNRLEQEMRTLNQRIERTLSRGRASDRP